MPHQTPGISVIRADLVLKKRVMLDQFQINFPANQWTCLLGKSKTGKTSLLRLIANLSFHSLSKIKSKQIDIETTDHLPLKHRVAYLTPHHSMVPWLNVFENAILGLKLRGSLTHKTKSEAIEHLKQVGLEDSLHFMPKQLTAEMKQRVAIARTLIEQKTVVLMDEPFSNLDAITRLNLQDLSARLFNHHTVILVTHDPIEALRLGHVIKVLKGSPVEVGNSIVPYSTQLPRPIDDPQLPQFQNEIYEQLLKKDPLP